MTPERAADGDAVGLGRGGRMSRHGKREAVLRRLGGEELEGVSRSLGVRAARLSGGREAFLAAVGLAAVGLAAVGLAAVGFQPPGLTGGEARLATRPVDGAVGTYDAPEAGIDRMS